MSGSATDTTNILKVPHTASIDFARELHAVDRLHCQALLLSNFLRCAFLFCLTAPQGQIHEGVAD